MFQKGSYVLQKMFAPMALRADLPLVNGDPIANIKLIENPAQNFLVIMKGGTIDKNTVA